MLKTTDELEAPDGHKMTWTLDTKPQRMCFFNEHGTQTQVVSGTFGQTYLQKRVKLFRRVHFYAQPTLTGMEQTP